MTLDLAAYAFGALTFSTLALFYWSERRRGSRHPVTVFPVFTLVCAVAFVDSLVFQFAILQGAPAPLAVAVILVRDLTAGLLPALMLHLVFEIAGRGLPARRLWRGALVALYAAAGAAAVGKGLDETGLLSTPWGIALYRAPSAGLALAAAMGLALQIASRHGTLDHRSLRRWIGALLVLMLVCAGAGLFGVDPILGQLPDYLLLAFFCVTLYYRERLVFFDVLVKRGMFLALGLAILAAALASNARAAVAVAAAAMWLLGPWIYSRLSRAIDHVWLRRPYSPAGAERQFIHDIQAAVSEDDLRLRSAASLDAIFQSAARVSFDGSAAPAADAGSLAADLDQRGSPMGSIFLPPRRNRIPFLSDDRKLLQSLAGALSVVLENVRFRADRRRQEEREQQLRWLASRAELKALRAQINPHFLFNALSVIAGLLHYKPELADETIEQLAQVFRYTLRKSENEWSGLGEEVDFVSAYLRVEQARFGDRLELEISVDPAAARFPIPALSIQPLIENAIKHGVSGITGRGRVTLRAGLRGGDLAVEVCDNGPGFPPGYSPDTPGEGHGLRNVMERLRGYYGDAARLSCENGPDGARVVLILPGAAAHARTDR